LEATDATELLLCVPSRAADLHIRFSQACIIFVLFYLQMVVINLSITAYLSSVYVTKCLENDMSLADRILFRTNSCRDTDKRGSPSRLSI
jgi:hypothetical protein